jgi:hypothetical protein
MMMSTHSSGDGEVDLDADIDADADAALDIGVDAGAPPIDPADPRLQAILGDRETHEYLCAILRKRGVHEQDVLDKLSAVIEAALRSGRLPLDDPGRARKLLGGFARKIALHAGRERGRAMKHEPLHDHEEHLAGKSPPSHETTEVARVAIETGQELYGREFDLYVRSQVKGETSASIAADLKVSSGYVRTRIAAMGRGLREVLTARGVVPLVLLLVISGVAYDRWRRGSEVNVSAPNPSAVAHARAEVLRRRAQDECAAEAWRACADDLDHARAMDPDGETPATRALRQTAKEHLPPADDRPQGPPAP